MRWFETLFGIPENPRNIYANFKLLNDKLLCKATNKTYNVGQFSTPTVQELIDKCTEKYIPIANQSWSISHDIIGDVLEMHHKHSNAVFQCASQFNCLEFTSPNMTPLNGITIYDCDRTQGPACAIACGAGTLVRNYFKQPINLIDNVQKIVGDQYYNIKNGYLMCDGGDLVLQDLNAKLTHVRNQCIRNIKVGWHQNVVY